MKTLIIAIVVILAACFVDILNERRTIKEVPAGFGRGGSASWEPYEAPVKTRCEEARE